MRLTIFTEGPSSQDPSDWWRTVAQTDPETTTVHPREGKSEAVGPLNDHTLKLTITADRVDWILTPNVASPVVNGRVARLGPIGELTQQYLSLFRPWLDSFSEPILRLAFGTTLLAEVPSKVAGYEKLGQLTKLPIDAENSSDFLYRINRRRRSTSLGAELFINRISNWALTQAGGMRLTVTNGRTILVPDDPTFDVTLELDINTVPEMSYILPSDRLSAILEECVNLGAEIAQRGDIP